MKYSLLGLAVLLMPLAADAAFCSAVYVNCPDGQESFLGAVDGCAATTPYYGCHVAQTVTLASTTPDGAKTFTLPAPYTVPATVIPIPAMVPLPDFNGAFGAGVSVPATTNQTTPPVSGTSNTTQPFGAAATTAARAASVDANTSPATPITPGLAFGSHGTTVAALQDTLISIGILAAGNDTGYFGSLTRTAVQTFQTQQGIVTSGDETSTGFGLVGPRTISALSTIMSVATAPAATTPAFTSTQQTSATSTPITNPSTLATLQSQLQVLQAQLASMTAVPATPSVPSGITTPYTSNVPISIISVTTRTQAATTTSEVNLPLAPTATPASGTYSMGQAVVFSATGATSVHYTTDGTSPTCTNGTVYGSNGANYIYVGSSITIEAIACNGSGASSVATASYSIQSQSPCDPGWTLVPGNGRLGTGDFCVMQFQAQNPLGSVRQYATCSSTPAPGTETYCTVPQSVLSQQPMSAYSDTTLRYAWNYVTPKQAALACQSIGAKLMDVPHAQTINLNLVAQAKNWQSGSVAQGCLFGGNMDGFHWDGEEPLPAPHGTDSTADPYEFEGISSSVIAAKQPVCPFPTIGSGIRGGYAERRSFYLSNGGVIWDWSGNLGEWLINILPNNANGQTSSFTSPNGNGMGYWDSNAIADQTPNNQYTDWTKSYLADSERPWIGPYDPNVPALSTMNRNNGMGGYIGPTAPGSVAYRGGSYYKGYDAGIFHIDIGHGPTFNNLQIGFRCYKDVGTQPSPLFISSTVLN